MDRGDNNIMGSWKIQEQDAKTALVNADLYALGDSEDLSGSDFSIKKTALSDLATYMQNTLNFAGATIKYLTNTDSPFTITDGDGYGTFICDTSTADIDIITPTLTDNQNRDLEFIHQVGGNNLNIDGEGAETIDGLIDIDLPKQGDRLKIKGTTSEWAITEERVSCQLRLNTYAGYGSTDNKIPRLTNAVENYGNFFTENHSTGYNGNTEGLEITINKSGKYSFTFSPNQTPGYFAGISLNSSQLTTSITGINVADKMVVCYQSNAGTESAIPVTLKIEKNDVVRIHTDGTAAVNAARYVFSCTYVGN